MALIVTDMQVCKECPYMGKFGTLSGVLCHSEDYQDCPNVEEYLLDKEIITLETL